MLTVVSGCDAFNCHSAYLQGVEQATWMMLVGGVAVQCANLQAVKPSGPFQTMDKFENAVLQIRVRDFYHGAKADRD